MVANQGYIDHYNLMCPSMFWFLVMLNSDKYIENNDMSVVTVETYTEMAHLLSPNFLLWVHYTMFLFIINDV